MLDDDQAPFSCVSVESEIGLTLQENVNSILNAMAMGPTMVESGDPILFDINRIVVGKAMKHTEGSEDVVVDMSGIYRVTFRTDAMLAEDFIENDVCALIAINGVIIPGTKTTATVEKGQTASLFTQTVCYVPERSTVRVNILNPVGAGTTLYTNSSIIIDQMC